MFRSYRVNCIVGNKYKIDVTNNVMRELFTIFKQDKHIPINMPVSDSERAEFENIILRSGISPKDDVATAKEKYKAAVATANKPRGYTSADIQALKNKIFNKKEQ